MSAHPRYRPVSFRSTVARAPDQPSREHVSLVFDYTLDFGRESTVTIYRLQEPSEIPRPSDYTETLPVAYYMSVDPRYQVVLLTPNYDTAASISFANYPRADVRLMELTPQVDDLDPVDSDDQDTGAPRTKNRLRLAKARGNKSRFEGDWGDVITWEHDRQDDTYDLWVMEGLKSMPTATQPTSMFRWQRRGSFGATQSQNQTRLVASMRRTIIEEFNVKRIKIDVNTKYVNEVMMLASAVAVLKRDALEETQKQRSYSERNRGFALATSGFAIAYGASMN